MEYGHCRLSLDTRNPVGECKSWVLQSFSSFEEVNPDLANASRHLRLRLNARHLWTLTVFVFVQMDLNPVKNQSDEGYERRRRENGGEV